LKAFKFDIQFIRCSSTFYAERKYKIKLNFVSGAGDSAKKHLKSGLFSSQVHRRKFSYLRNASMNYFQNPFQNDNL